MNQEKVQPINNIFNLMTSPDWQDFELLDSGGGAKLERYGDFLLVRPEAEAIWQPALPESEWKKANAKFTSSDDKNGGYWKFDRNMPESWHIAYKGLKCRLQISASRHIGIFPEQACQWDWLQSHVEKCSRPPKVLNLFGYTGMATLAAARAGARVTHLDASKKAVSWARDNQQLSGLDKCPIRWLVDDAMKFVQREKRRSSLYDGIMMDPPKFGRGPQGEVWEFFKLLPTLLHACRDILSPEASFVMLTAYAVKASSITLRQSLQEMVGERPGILDAGEIAIEEKSAARLLPTSIFASWAASTA